MTFGNKEKRGHNHVIPLCSQMQPEVKMILESLRPDSLSPTHYIMNELFLSTSVDNQLHHKLKLSHNYASVVVTSWISENVSQDCILLSSKGLGKRHVMSMGR